MTEFQIALLMFSIGWCLCGIFIVVIKLNQITNKLDEMLKGNNQVAVKQNGK